MPVQSKIIVLDRDGVINHDSADYIKTADEWRPLPGALTTMACLQGAGYRLAIASNQSGLGRGLFSAGSLEKIHHKLQSGLAEEGGSPVPVFYCPHRPDEGCDCRKPRTGLLQQIAKHFGEDLNGQLFVGDSLKDLQAARAFAMEPVLVRTGNGQEVEAELASQGLAGVRVFDDLAALGRQLLDGAG